MGPCDHKLDHHGLVGMVHPRHVDRKVRKASEHPWQQIVHRLRAIVNGTERCNLVTRMEKGGNRARNVMSVLGANMLVHDGLTALSEAEA
jgi:hypothetical protein